MGKKNLKNRSILASNIFRLRTLKKWRAQDLADKVGVTVKVISEIENDHTEGSTDTRHKIAKALGVRFEELYLPEGFGRLKDLAAFLSLYDSYRVAKPELKAMVRQLFDLSDDDLYNLDKSQPVDFPLGNKK